MQNFNSFNAFTQNCIKQSVRAAITLLNADHAGSHDLNQLACNQLMLMHGMRVGENILSDEITAAVAEYIAAHVKLTFVE